MPSRIVLFGATGYTGRLCAERLVARGVAADPALLEPQWRATVEDVLAEATLTVPETTWRPTGGRRGAHTTGFGYLLAELQHLHRSHPGASW